MVSVKWYGINSLEFRYSSGTFMIDPYVSRDRVNLIAPGEQEKYLSGSKPDFVLMTHSHWDHLPDMLYLFEKSDTILYASRTACNIMRALGVKEKNLHEISYGEKLSFPGLKVTCLESRHMGNIPLDEVYREIPLDKDFKERTSWLCGEVFAFLLEMDDLVILNGGSANLHIPSMKGISCDYLIYGISRWKEGFPELLTENLSFKRFIGVHHDEFTRPLSEFSLRDDMDRLKAALPGLPAMELPILQWVNLEKI